MVTNQLYQLDAHAHCIINKKHDAQPQPFGCARLDTGMFTFFTHDFEQ